MRPRSTITTLAALVLASVAPARAETVAELFERVHCSVVVVRAVEIDVPSEEGQAANERGRSDGWWTAVPRASASRSPSLLPR